MKPSRYEKEFIFSCIVKLENRLDGRDLSSGRILEIGFSENRDTAIIYLGNTKVLSKVVAEITAPRDVKPTEGIIRVFFEPSPIASPDSKVGNKSSDAYTEIQKGLESCIRDSRCVDAESLCIIGGLKVWTITVYIHALNDDGNLLECASIAAISSLASFRRPDVTVTGQQACIYTADTRDPKPLILHHMPIIICLGLYNSGKCILVDPTIIEEEAADGCVICCVNAHQEICFVRHRGALLLTEEVERKCLDLAIHRAELLTKEIRTALSDDEYKIATKQSRGYVNMLHTNTVLDGKTPRVNVNLTALKQSGLSKPEVVTIQDSDASDTGETGEQNTSVVKVNSNAKKRVTSGIKVKSKAREHALRILKKSKITLFEGGSSKWDITESSDTDESSEETEQSSPEAITIPDKEKPLSKSNVSTATKEESTSESEEETAFVAKDQVDVKVPATRGWYTRDPFF